MTERVGQKERTRQRIVEAVVELVTDEHPASLSVPAVARTAGTSVATVYRYFPTKEALLDAASLIGGEETREKLSGFPTTFAEFDAVLPFAFAELARHLPLARNQLASPLGRELRRRRWLAKATAVDAAMARDGLEPTSPAGRRLAAVVDVLTSSTALLELHDKAGLPVDEAAAVVSWAVKTLLEASR